MTKRGFRIELEPNGSEWIDVLAESSLEDFARRVFNMPVVVSGNYAIPTQRIRMITEIDVESGEVNE